MLSWQASPSCLQKGLQGAVAKEGQEEIISTAQPSHQGRSALASVTDVMICYVLFSTIAPQGRIHCLCRGAHPL